MLQNRVWIIEKLIHDRMLHSYLEIGVGDGWTFNQIECDYKVGVDPVLSNSITEYKGMVYNLTSVDFFKQNTLKFDLIFIDGLHLYEQVICDIMNAFNFLNNDGFIVLHDCLPVSEEMAGRVDCGFWTGDVYKAIVWFRDNHNHIPCFVIDCDYGCGVIHKTGELNAVGPETVSKYDQFDFNWLVNNLDRLNLKTVDYLEIYLEGIKNANGHSSSNVH